MADEKRAGRLPVAVIRLSKRRRDLAGHVECRLRLIDTSACADQLGRGDDRLQDAWSACLATTDRPPCRLDLPPFAAAEPAPALDGRHQGHRDIESLERLSHDRRTRLRMLGEVVPDLLALVDCS